LKIYLGLFTNILVKLGLYGSAVCLVAVLFLLNKFFHISNSFTSIDVILGQDEFSVVSVCVICVC
jgi:hypothetical protein